MRLRIPRAKENELAFYNHSSDPANLTVKELKSGARQVKLRGRSKMRKAELIEALKEKKAFNKPKGNHWFWLSEVHQSDQGGVDAPVWVCGKCGCANILRQFSVDAYGTVNPSLICGDCKFHPWGHLVDWKDEDKQKEAERRKARYGR